MTQITRGVVFVNEILGTNTDKEGGNAKSLAEFIYEVEGYPWDILD